MWLAEPAWQKKHSASLISWTRIPEKATGVSCSLNQNYQKSIRHLGSGRTRIPKKASGVLEAAGPELQKMHLLSWKRSDCLPKKYTGRYKSLRTGSSWARITRKAFGVLEAAEPELQKKHPASSKQLNQSKRKCVRRHESILIARQKNSISTTRHLASLRQWILQEKAVSPSRTCRQLSKDMLSNHDENVDDSF
jgi:hypothetical protein